MSDRRNEYDVTNSVDTTSPADVSDTVRDIYQDLYQKDAPGNLGQVFSNLGLLYQGT